MDESIDKKITTRINSDIVLTEPSGGIRFGTDALLLADFARSGAKKGKCLDIGTGSGVLPLLLLASGSKASFIGIELQKPFADAASDNSRVNGFADAFSVINADASEYKKLFAPNSFNAVITNPPYMKKDCGKSNLSHALAVARREESGSIALFCSAASWCLGTNGRFFAVYRAERLVTLLSSMRDNRIEPKRIKFVRPDAASAPTLVLIEGIKDAGEGMVFEPDLCIYSEPEHKNESFTLNEIYSRFGGRNG